MRRFATAPLKTFEDLFERARTDVVRLDGLEYPPGCADSSGCVSFALGRTGAMIMHVRPGACSSSEFRMRLLFETGACVFSSPEDLGHFCTGTLATAFEIEPAERIAPPFTAGEETGNELSAGVADSRAESLLADLGPKADAGTNDSHDTGTAIRPHYPPQTASTADREPSPPRASSRRTLTTATLSTELARAIHGQAAALERVASAAVAHLTKRHPSRPGSVVLIGPTGVGKTSTIEALPRALRTLGVADAHLFRIDCAELTDSMQLTRLLGSPPGYSGHTETTPLIEALEKPGCILLVDEVEKAHDDILDLLLGLLDGGRLTTPAGRVIDASHAVVAMTTSVSSSRLVERLGSTPLEDRWRVQRTCVEHLRCSGLPADLIGRIGAFAFYREVFEKAVRTEVSRAAISELGCEYGLIVGDIDPVVLEVVDDIASDGGSVGARALRHAARELLAERFADLAGDGGRVPVAIDAGPPVAVRLTPRTPESQ